ncbi:NAD(P)-linked oxidoreductase [Venustampulla echinocandica]|uniref:NAD(P)-linked oxidoreductase n=1 Tax=Venustampulla echinocandica TaxID=2656787 RepID=A0A370U3E1_9HELO|nr:NAD(P)-linked oxidoreductase [Venustampulla echinocandica]RDL42275.1 NAD(P)-linked oxidoreductase [Venustampulla echinocandica]
MPQILGKEIGPIGYGLMGLTWRLNAKDVEESIQVMKTALDAGCNFWNGGEFYGTPEYNSLHLLNQYFTKYPEDADKVILSIKGALSHAGGGPDPSPEGIKRSVENCLKVLDGKKKIDLFESARMDKKTPIEDTVKAIDDYVKAGKIGGISLSEVSAATIHRAAKVAKIAACEVELSMFSLDILNNGVAAACAEHNIPIVAYSPLSRGLLTGDIKTPADLAETDMRHHFPRFQGENYAKNLELVQKVEELAREKGCTPAQLAINWVRHLSKRDGNPEIFPIPGATKVDRVLENSKVVELSNGEAAAIYSILKKFEVAGTRYPATHSTFLEG